MIKSPLSLFDRPPQQHLIILTNHHPARPMKTIARQILNQDLIRQPVSSPVVGDSWQQLILFDDTLRHGAFH